MSNATQSQVAMEVDVDRTTVSKILNGYQIDKFSPKVVEKVKAAALELGYKSRDRKASCDIGFVFPSLQETNGIYSDSYRILEAIMGISDALKSTNNGFHIMNYNDKFNIKAKSADAFLIWETFSKKFLNDLNKKKIEYITLNRVSADYDGSYVIHDDQMAFRMTAECLMNANHKHIALVSNSKNKLVDEYVQTVSSTLGKNGTCHLFNLQDNSHIDIVKMFKKNNITGIIACDDVVCYKVIELIMKAGARIPDDYSIITNNYINSYYPNSLKLTGIKTPWYELAKRGAELLIARTKGNTKYKSTIKEIISPIFISGNTVISL